MKRDVLNPFRTTRLYEVECGTWNGGYSFNYWRKSSAMRTATRQTNNWPWVCIINNWTGERIVVQNKLPK